MYNTTAEKFLDAKALLLLLLPRTSHSTQTRQEKKPLTRFLLCSAAQERSSSISAVHG
jgi:hypothetical protein